MNPEVSTAIPSISPQKIALFSLVVALIALAILVILNTRRSKSRGNTFLLLGPQDAGKTSILSMLVYGQTLQTHTSLQANSSIISLSSAKRDIKIVDIPGHPRVRDQFQEHLNDAKSIAFVVDASTVSRNGPIVAEHLHNVLHTLTSLPPSQTLPSLVILAHKADLLNPTTGTNTSDNLAINRVKTVLERELEKRRVAQSGGVGVEGLGAEGEKSDLGGLECAGSAGGSFKFADWEGGEITFIGTSARPGSVEEKVPDVGLSSLREWLDDNM